VADDASHIISLSPVTGVASAVVPVISSLCVTVSVADTVVLMASPPLNNTVSPPTTVYVVVPSDTMKLLNLGPPPNEILI
jgi:hypothetical protein